MTKMTSKPGPGLKRLQDIITGLDGATGKVGFFETARYNDAKQTPIAYVAAIQENGAPSAAVPSRPFMRPTIDRESVNWKNLFRDGAKAVIKGDRTAESVMELVSMRAASDVQYTLSTIQDPPLSKITLMARKYKLMHGPNSITGKGMIVGFMKEFKRLKGNVDISGVSTKPLNDSGALIAHVTSIVSKE